MTPDEWAASPAGFPPTTVLDVANARHAHWNGVPAALTERIPRGRMIMATDAGAALGGVVLYIGTGKRYEARQFGGEWWIRTDRDEVYPALDPDAIVATVWARHPELVVRAESEPRGRCRNGIDGCACGENLGHRLYRCYDVELTR